MENKKPIRILHVEDEMMFTFIVGKFLEGDRFKVDTAKDGAEAVSIAFRNTYDLILMDIMMPVMDGLTAAKTIKKMSPKVPIIAFTAFEIKPQDEEFIDGIIRKPVLKEELIESILRFYEKSLKK